MAAKTKIQPVVTKAVLSRTSGKPIATVKVPANVRSIRLAGAYTIGGDAVNVSTNKVTANASTLAKIQTMDVPVAQYHKESETFFLSKD